MTNECNICLEENSNLILITNLNWNCYCKEKKMCIKCIKLLKKCPFCRSKKYNKPKKELNWFVALAGRGIYNET